MCFTKKQECQLKSINLNYITYPENQIAIEKVE